MATQFETEQAQKPLPFDALSLVAVLWAGQTLVQLTSAPNSTALPQTVGWLAMVSWAGVSTIAGWLAFALAIGTLLNPGRLRLFFALIAAASVHYIADWPFVSNHLILDTLISLAMLGAAALVLNGNLFRRVDFPAQQRSAMIEKFSPVVISMFMLMYYFIVISKMNRDFFEEQISCMQGMYASFLDKSDIIARVFTVFDSQFLFLLFMVIEWLIPVLLMFRKTRLLAIYIGVPFHLLLGVMGHYWYSSLVLTLYVIVALPAIMAAMPAIIQAIGAKRLSALWLAYRIYVIVLAAVFIASAVLAPEDGLLGYRPVILHWAAAFGLAGLLTLFAVARTHWRDGPLSAAHSPKLLSRAPGLLWIIVALMSLNSLSPYIGFKTTNSVAMYSNMRTENGENNHFFMPRLALFDYQDDLVEVLDSSNPAIAELKGWPVLYGDPNVRIPVYITYFELRRAVSRTEDSDLKVRYRRNGVERLYDRSLSQSPDPDLGVRHPFWLEKTAMFRPIFKDRAYCLH